jgi:hypothetical protein
VGYIHIIPASIYVRALQKEEGRKEEDLILLRFCGGWESFQKSAAGNEADGIFAVAVSSFLCVLLLASSSIHPAVTAEREERETVSLLLPLDVYTWWWIGYGNGV